MVHRILNDLKDARTLLGLTAFTQTYATASHTHSNPTAAAIATTGVTQTTPYGFSTSAQGDAAVAAINALVVDMANVKQVLNGLLDDLQSLKALA